MPRSPQQGRRPDARKLQQLRRVDGAAAQDQFAGGARLQRLAVLDIFDANGAATFKQDLRRQRLHLDAQVVPLHRRTQEGACRRHAAAALGVDLVDADAFLRGAIEILVERQTGLGCRLEKLPRQWVHVSAIVGDAHRPAAATIIVGAGLVVLHCLEVGQKVVKAPAGIAEVAPVIVVVAVAPDPHHGVDRARTAEQLAARPVIGIAGQPRVRFGLVIPVDGRIEERLAVAERHLHEEAKIAAAGFQHQHRMTPARRQPLGNDRTGRAGADDDEIIGLHGIDKRPKSRRQPRERAPRTSCGVPAWPVKNATVPYSAGRGSRRSAWRATAQPISAAESSTPAAIRKAMPA